LWIKKRNVVDDAGRINCYSFSNSSSFSNRTKEKAEGTASRNRRRRHAHFSGFDTQEGIPKRASQALLAANETTATFDLTHKRDKSNIIYQNLIKNRHLDKIKSVFSNI
jgi:hypothetical protein